MQTSLFFFIIVQPDSVLIVYIKGILVRVASHPLSCEPKPVQMLSNMKNDKSPLNANKIPPKSIGLRYTATFEVPSSFYLIKYVTLYRHLSAV